MGEEGSQCSLSSSSSIPGVGLARISGIAAFKKTISLSETLVPFPPQKTRPVPVLENHWLENLGFDKSLTACECHGSGSMIAYILLSVGDL